MALNPRRKAPPAAEPEAPPDRGREIASALALAARPLNRSTWAELIGFAGVRNGSRAITTTELRDRAVAWCEAGVMLENGRGELELAPALLHRHKRNLADSLLDGMATGAPLELDALRELLADLQHEA
jgi:hypothetical protein